MKPPRTREARRAGLERRHRAEAQISAADHGAGLAPPPQAAALLAEMLDVFEAGAFLATVILAQAALDADLAERAEAERFSGYRRAAADGIALNERRYGRGYVWLRARRNALLHADSSGDGGGSGAGPGLAVSVQDREDAAALERDAHRAVDLAIKGLSVSPDLSG